MQGRSTFGSTELCGFGIAHIVYEGDKHSVPERLVHELSQRCRPFDCVTINTGLVDVNDPE